MNTLTEYVSGYLARTIVNGLSYVLAYILATIGIRDSGLYTESDRRTPDSENGK